MTSRPRTRIPTRPSLGVLWSFSSIIISSDSSDESVGSPPSRIILFGDIPTVIPSTSVIAPETSTIAPAISSAAPVVETTLVASPTGLCGLVPYTGSDSDFQDEPARGLASRHAITSLPDHHSPSSSSSSDSSPVHSLGLDAPDQAHSGSSTRDVSPRLRYPPRRAPRHSEAYFVVCCLRYLICIPPTTSEYHQEILLSIGDGDVVGDRVGIDHRDATDDTEEYEADASTGDTAEAGIDPMTAPLVEEEIVEPAGEGFYDWLASGMD
ncbi:hypothetical protein Tco_1105626 [Tanacetum coccineum]